MPLVHIMDNIWKKQLPESAEEPLRTPLRNIDVIISLRTHWQSSKKNYIYHSCVQHTRVTRLA